MKKFFIFVILISNAVTAPSIAKDCRSAALKFSDNKSKQHLLRTRVSLPIEFNSTGNLELVGFRCITPVKSGESIAVVMGKRVSQPQFDVIYTDIDGVRFSNIMQAPAMPWGDVVEIDMVSTVVSDTLKHFRSYQQQSPLDQRTIYQELREASSIRAWAKARALRISQNPLTYAYPLPANEVKLLEQSKNAYSQTLKRIHQAYVRNVIQQPESLLDNFLLELSREKPRKQVLAGMSRVKSSKNSFLENLELLKIGQVSNIVTMRKNPLDGQAVYQVHYVDVQQEASYVRKVRMKRIGNKWYISAVDKPKRI